MSEDAPAVPSSPKRFRFDWIGGVLFKPRKSFKDIMAQRVAVWVLPMLLLTLTGLINAGVSGFLAQRQAMMAGPVMLPENMEGLSPDQQQQFLQSASIATSVPVIYGTRIAMMLARVWIGALVVTGVLHLLLTLFGVSGEFKRLNLVAWASLPFAVKDVLQILAMLVAGQPISGPGLSGFAPQSAGMVVLAVATACLGLIEIYPFWRMALLVVGIQQGAGQKTGRAILPVAATFLILFGFQTLAAGGFAALGSAMTGGRGGGF